MDCILPVVLFGCVIAMIIVAWELSKLALEMFIKEIMEKHKR